MRLLSLSKYPSSGGGGSIVLTTNGTSGPATFIGGTLNIPTPITPTILTAENGLSLVGTEVELGGILLHDTTVDLSGGFNLGFTTTKGNFTLEPQFDGTLDSNLASGPDGSNNHAEIQTSPTLISLHVGTGAFTYTHVDITSASLVVLGALASIQAQLQIQDGTQGIAGYVFTSIDTNGTGAWMPLPAPIPATVTSANDGLSLSGTIVQLGQLSGGSGGQLLDNREIPMNGFSLLFSGIGHTNTGIIIFKADAAKTLTTPFLFFEDSTGAEIGRINFTANSTYIGAFSGSQDTFGTSVNVGVGFQALTSVTSGSRNTAVGTFALALCTTGAFNVAFGEDSLDQLTTGNENVAIGRNSGLNITTGINNMLIGGEITTIGGASSNNVFVGVATGGAGGSLVIANGNTFIGGLIFEVIPSYGNNNVAIGFNINSASGSVIGINNILIGANIIATDGINNTTVIGEGITCNISNVAVLGRADQDVIIGSTVSPTDSGIKLQVIGNISNQGTQWAIRTVTSNTAISINDNTIVVDTSGGTIVVSANPATLKVGIFNIKKKGTDGNSVTVNMASGSIYGSLGPVSSFTFSNPGESITLHFDGTNAYIL